MKDKREDLLRGRARMSGFTVKRLMSRVGMTRSTMYKRLRLPGTMTLDELASIDRAIKFEDEEILRMVRG